MEVSKRNQKTEGRKAEILRNAMKVFAKEGFHRTDVQEIADLAKVGKGTVYRHFGNKEELFLAVAKYSLEQMGEFFMEHLNECREPAEIAAQGDIAELLRRIGVVYARYYETHPYAVEIMIHERAEFRESVFPTHLMYRAENRSGLDSILAAAAEAGQIRAYDAQKITDALADLLFGSVVNGCLAGGSKNLVERVSQAMEMFIQGLIPEQNHALETKSVKSPNKEGRK
ncbi:TetR family transcriptional regulator [Planctomycetales bacterium 10988]|nr:TetR family transcriptional regulator [Planctomycetales bacterium 10988]